MSHVTTVGRKAGRRAKKKPRKTGAIVREELGGEVTVAGKPQANRLNFRASEAETG
jgi:hypothetical protein